MFIFRTNQRRDTFKKVKKIEKGKDEKKKSKSFHFYILLYSPEGEKLSQGISIITI